jgi:lysophospholipase L1-like esterase
MMIAQSFGHSRISVYLLPLFVVFGVVALGLDNAYAQGGRAEDVNGDGSIQILTFGDSITYGVGDGERSGDYIEELAGIGKPRGYPLRLSKVAGWQVSNAGIPGEQLLQGGVQRYPDAIVGSDVDVVVVMEGVNDAVQRVEAAEYRAAMQRIINVTRAEGKNMLLVTLPPTTGLRESLAPYTNLYSSIIRDIASLNDVAVADLEKRFQTDCPELSSCALYNIPEGLHPNTSGYDVVAEVIRAGLTGESN